MTDLDRKLTDTLSAAAAGAELPDRLRQPSGLLHSARRGPLRVRMAGMVAAVALLVATAGVTAAQSGLLRFDRSAAEAVDLAGQVRQAEAAAPEIGALTLAYPVQNGTVVDRFGQQQLPAGGGTRLHAGIDLAAPAGTTIVAAAAGTVTATGAYPELGLVVVVTHGKVNGSPISTWYAHNGKVLVKAGDIVGAGQPLAEMGVSGASTGPHLHFEVRQDGKPVDPMAWLH